MKKFRKISRAVFLLMTAVLFLDWAALHDIVAGNEPDYVLEWATLLASGGVFLFLGVYFHRIFKK